MVKIRLLKRAAGPAGNYAAGSVIEVQAETAEAMIAGGHAEAVDPPARAPKRAKPAETATAKAGAETAEGRRAPRKRAKR